MPRPFGGFTECVPTMSKEPEPDEMIDITGPDGESLFWHLKDWLVSGHESTIQEHLDQDWEHYKDIEDHRLLALVAGLCVERGIDALLLAFAPGFDEYEEDSDLTFSMKIKVARSMRLLPSRILTACDLIRQIRNEFVHHLDYKDFGQLDKSRFRNKLLPYVQSFNKAKRNEEDYKQLFKDLVGFTLVSLYAYKEQVYQLRKYLMTPDLREAFKKWSEKNRP